MIIGYLWNVFDWRFAMDQRMSSFLHADSWRYYCISARLLYVPRRAQRQDLTWWWYNHRPRTVHRDVLDRSAHLHDLHVGRREA